MSPRAAAAAFAADLPCTRAQIALVLGVDERSITNYQSATPPIPTVQEGRRVWYPLAPCVAWYVEHERGRAREQKLPSELEMARSRKAIADARRTELELAQLEGQLLPAAYVDEFCETLAERVAAVATGGLAGFVAEVQRAETTVQSQRLLERIGDTIIGACQRLTEELRRDEDALDEAPRPAPHAPPAASAAG